MAAGEPAGRSRRRSLTGMSALANVRIYTTPWCGYCSAALALLKGKGVQYEQIDVSSDPSLRRQMTELSGRTTVPQIFIDERPVGGYDDIYALDAAGKLDPLLGLSPKAGEE